MRRKAISFVLAPMMMMFGASLAAHDFWLQPTRFWVAANAPIPVMLLVGHGEFRTRSDLSSDRINRIDVTGPKGKFDLKRYFGAGEPTADMRFSLASPGTHVVAFSSSNTPSDLPALRFNDYIATEGLTLIMADRARNGRSGKPGRELYSRRAKLLIQVGPPGTAPQPQVTAPVGLGLEIVPLRNPYAPGAALDLPVRVLYQGEPLAGALVKLNNLNADATPIQMRRTDSAGQAVFRLRPGGAWQLNVVWGVRLPNVPAADYLTIFSSLTFGSPNAKPPR